MTRTSFEIERIVAAGGKPQGYPDGGIIFIKGDRGECAYAVQSGRVEIREAGRVIEALEPGELFGEMALIDQEPRSASAVAIGPVELVAVDLGTFNALVRADPDFATTVMRLMARRLRAMHIAQRPPESLPLPPRQASV